jgi:hypothetical protein
MRRLLLFVQIILLTGCAPHTFYSTDPHPKPLPVAMCVAIHIDNRIVSQCCWQDNHGVHCEYKE